MIPDSQNNSKKDKARVDDTTMLNHLSSNKLSVEKSQGYLMINQYNENIKILMNDMSQPGQQKSSAEILNQSSKYLLSTQGYSQKKIVDLKNTSAANKGSNDNIRYRDLKIQNLEANFESANNSKKGGNNRYQISPKDLVSSS